METPSNNQFKRSDYAGVFNYLEHERVLIIRSLIRVMGNVKSSYNLLFPTEYISYEAYKKLLVRHNINLDEIRHISAENKKARAEYDLINNKTFNDENTNVNSDYVQANLRKLSEREHIKLRSLKNK